MPQSLAKVLLHTVFSTKDRQPFLRDETHREEMHRYLGGILNQLDCLPITIGGVSDHVHLLFTLPRTLTLADAIKELKRGSTLWFQQYGNAPKFAWQNGYGAFSIGFSQIPAVRKYIAEQAKHHQTISFQDEFRTLLQRYQVPFDENTCGNRDNHNRRGHAGNATPSGLPAW